MGRTGGSVEEVGLEVGPIEVSAGSMICVPSEQEEITKIEMFESASIS